MVVVVVVVVVGAGGQISREKTRCLPLPGGHTAIIRPTSCPLHSPTVAATLTRFPVQETYDRSVQLLATEFDCTDDERVSANPRCLGPFDARVAHRITIRGHQGHLVGL